MPQLQRKKRPLRPRQTQPRQPGLEEKMKPRPEAWIKTPRREPRLAGRVAVISGGDSGIRRAVAFAFASEGADVAILYLNEHRDAKETVRAVESAGWRAIAMAGDIGNEGFCQRAIGRVMKELGRLDIVVNNAAEQHPQKTLEKITAKQLERTFRTNIFSFFFLTKAALPHSGKAARSSTPRPSLPIEAVLR
jgi:NAD(P)-dependent dehydrogenase (short-subunit alcohol dehydrogenase family)